MNHIQRMYCCQSDRAARKSSEAIAADLQTYRSATVYGINLREQVPDRINVNDEIENTKFGTAFRNNYARHLVYCWIDHNRKTIIDSAYRIAIIKLKRELHIASSAAKNILLNRCKNDFYEYQHEGY